MNEVSVFGSVTLLKNGVSVSVSLTPDVQRGEGNPGLGGGG